MAGLADLLQGILGQLGQGQPMATQVGDHNNPALLQQAMAQFQAPQQAQAAPQQQLAPQQAPQGQPMPQSAPQGAPDQSGGGLGGILQSILSPQSSGRNQTVGWLQKQGLDQGTATVLASDKGALRQYIMQRSQGQKPIEIAGRLVDPNTFKVLADFSDKKNDQSRTLSEQEVSALKLTPGSYQMDGTGKITSIGGVREQDPTFGREKDLRQEYENNPNVKGYQIVRDNYERIRQGAQQTTGAGDLAIVFGYMKMLDPTSVVREGEQAAASNAAGVPAAVRNTYNSIMSGEKLSPEARQQMLAAAQQIYTESSKNLGDLNTRYSGIATNYKLDPSRIVQAPEQYDPLAPPPPQSGDGLPLPPPPQAPPLAAPAPQPPQPNASPTAPVVDWKDYFGKKAR